MTRMIGNLAVTLALLVALGTAFVGSASAKPDVGPFTCVTDDGYGRYSHCNHGG